MNLKNLKMPKDKVLSTKAFVISHLTLLILALAFFGGLYFILYPERFVSTPTNEYQPVTKDPVSLFLEITSPEDDILVNDANLVISGKTSSDTSIIISSQTNDTALQADNNGQFSKVFPLTLGANIIEINALDKEGNSKTITKSVFYEETKDEN